MKLGEYFVDTGKTNGCETERMANRFRTPKSSSAIIGRGISMNGGSLDVANRFPLPTKTMSNKVFFEQMQNKRISV